MPDETPQPTPVTPPEANTPAPVVSQPGEIAPKKRSALVLLVVAIVAVLVLLVLGIVAFMGSKNPSPSQPTSQVNPTPTTSLDTSLNKVDQNLSTLDKDANSVDSGLNDKADTLNP